MSTRRTSIATAPRNAAAIGLRFLSVVLMLLVLLALGVNTAPAQVDQGCSTGQAISDPTNNPGLVADCEALLGLKDELRGTASLNWSANLVMSGWDGITITTVDGAQRVTILVAQ